MASADLNVGKLTGSAPVRAAQYIRMSTERQQYSTLNQMIALREYAVQRGIEIVRTYTDEGKSGLTLARRMALRQLIQDVLSGTPDFSVVLVYDVSRWGRFQDVDESAHYEFICRQAGIHIEYCAEQFENDGSAFSAMVKSMKRLMAAEYSRELSVRVFAGHRRLVERGYRQGGAPGYALRRLLVAPDGVPRFVLHSGERKALHTDRTILIPGPLQEIAAVRSAFESCAAGNTIRSIADMLNARGLKTTTGGRWYDTTVGRMLHNEKYIGNNVWNKDSIKLGGKLRHNLPSDWIRSDGAFEPIVSREIFGKAREAIAERKRARSDEEMLEGLRRLMSEKGYLSRSIIAADERILNPSRYAKRFGTLANAYQLAGCTQPQEWRFAPIEIGLRILRSNIALEIAKQFRVRGIAAAVRPNKYLVDIESGLAIQVMVSRCAIYLSGAGRWKVRLVGLHKGAADIVAIVRLERGNREILDYHLIPRDKLGGHSFRFGPHNPLRWNAFRTVTLTPLYALAGQEVVDGEPMQDRVLRAIASGAAPVSQA